MTDRKPTNKPLLVFIIIGIFIFGIDALINTKSNTDITINDNTIKHIISTYIGSKSIDSLDQKTIDGLVINYIERELYYLEGIEMGLDKNDPVIKNRLAQKFQFLFQDEGAQSVNKTELIKHYNTNKHLYKKTGSIDFKHIFFSFDKHKDALVKAEEVYKNIQNKTLKFSKTLGNNYHIATDEFFKLSHNDVWRYFGKPFADSLFNINSTNISSPIKSGYGYHIVNILAFNNDETLPFEQVKTKVKNDFIDSLLIVNSKKQINALKQKYNVTFDLNIYKNKIDEQ